METSQPRKRSNSKSKENANLISINIKKLHERGHLMTLYHDIEKIISFENKALKDNIESKEELNTFISVLKEITKLVINDVFKTIGNYKNRDKSKLTVNFHPSSIFDNNSKPVQNDKSNNKGNQSLIDHKTVCESNDHNRTDSSHVSRKLNFEHISDFAIFKNTNSKEETKSSRSSLSGNQTDKTKEKKLKRAESSPYYKRIHNHENYKINTISKSNSRSRSKHHSQGKRK